MNAFSIIATSAVLTVAFFQQTSAESIVETDSSDWVDLYDPPYKTATELSADSVLRRELFEMPRKKVALETKFSGSLRVYKTGRSLSGKQSIKRESPSVTRQWKTVIHWAFGCLLEKDGN